MGFENGHSKYGGRRKGTPNKSTLNLCESLNSKKLDPIENIARLLPQLPPEKQVDVMLNLLQYIYPKRKAIENTSEAEAANILTVDGEFLRDELSKLIKYNTNL